MLDKKNTIEYKGKQYPIVFNINVLAEIQEKYGSVDAWTQLLNDENFKAIRWGFMVAINEGVDEFNEESDEKLNFLDEKQVGRLITSLGTDQSVIKLAEVLTDSLDEPDPNE